ncbi:CopG family transcriptional regulator [Streptomyces sp. NPDC051567]|uniref:CopG family transcriptional regulator n=1 Tax=Streptomyces sp. NPDC051567 TaxID=3365660 RepID=UPI0037A39198
MSDATQKYSISMPRAIAEAARARSGPSGLSAYVTAAVARQIERDNLNELIAAAEAEIGPISQEEIQAKGDILLGVRREQTIPTDSQHPSQHGDPAESDRNAA